MNYTKYSSEELAQFDIFEGMTSVSAVISSICDGLSERKIIKVIYNVERSDKKSRELKFLASASQRLGFTLEGVTCDEIDAIVSGNTHGSIVALCSKRTLPSLTKDSIVPCGFYALLDGIEDPYNFGYSVRSLYASGADGIILPPRNWMEFSGAVAKSSAGTSELANLYVNESEEAVKLFKACGYKVISASIRESVSIYEADFSGGVLLLVGGEKRGISRKLLDMCDTNVRIDYGRPFKGSLPTVSATSIIAFEIMRARKNKQN